MIETDPLASALAAVRAATLRRLAHRLGVRISPETTLLDVGTGSGAEGPLFRALGFAPSRIVGIDPDLSRLRARNSRSESPTPAQRMSSVLGVGESLPFRECAFDIAIAITLLSSVPSPDTRRAIVLEMLRVVAPGGSVLLFDLVRLRPGGRARTEISRREAVRLFSPLEAKIETMAAFPQGIALLRALGFSPHGAAQFLDSLSPLPMFLAAGVKKPRA